MNSLSSAGRDWLVAVRLRAEPRRRRTKQAVIALLACWLSVWPGLRADSNEATRRIEGWTVHIDPALWRDERDTTETALRLLQQQLAEIVRMVPAPALAKLQEVPLWLSPEYPGQQPRAEYHPGAVWLREHGRNPEMAKGIEFTNVRQFQKEMNRMPNFVLHELAHAYHDRVLPGGFDNPEIRAAYDQAKASGSYDRVERWHGNGQPNTFERAYALKDPMEYFAENSEAYFSRNDYFPFTRVELETHDPAMFKLLQRLWGYGPLR